jgi:phage shock protein PspC (stress-responsive transcriptional regulator)
MKKVIAINLNGNAYQVDEDGFNALRQYLERAETQLKDNPDKAEIISDLEQAIGEKCAGFLLPHKTVVTGAEVEQIIKDMGPVDGGEAATSPPSSAPKQAAEGKAAADNSAPKRLYRVREGSMIGGVCKGIAAYFDVDVTIVRIIFVILAIVTNGGWVLAYLVMMFVVPRANTTEERAAAHGAPFNAQEVIDQAKKHYSDFKEKDFTDRKEWRRHRREQRREWKREWKQRWREGSPWWGHTVQRNVGHAANNVSYAAQIVAGVLVPILGIANVLIFWAWLFAIISLATTSTIFGLPLPIGMPLWAGFILLIVAYNVCAWPLKAIRRSWYHAAHGDGNGSFAAWDGMMWLILTVVIFWFAYQNVPQIRYVMEHFTEIWNVIWQGLTSRGE